MQRAERRSFRRAEYKIFSLIRKKMAKGCNPEEIADILEEDLGYVQEVYKFLESQMADPRKQAGTGGERIRPGRNKRHSSKNYKNQALILCYAVCGKGGA